MLVLATRQPKGMKNGQACSTTRFAPIRDEQLNCNSEHTTDDFRLNNSQVFVNLVCSLVLASVAADVIIIRVFSRFV